MNCNVYKNENPVYKKAIETLKNTGKDKLSKLEKYSESHTKVETQDKIQDYLWWLSKLAKKSPELSRDLDDQLIKKDDIKTHLENYVKHSSDFKDTGSSPIEDSDDAKETLKIMNKYPKWQFYMGENGGTYHFDNMNPETDDCIIGDQDKDDLTDFYTNIRLYDFLSLEYIVNDSIDCYDDDYLDVEASSHKYDKYHHCIMEYQNEKDRYTLISTMLDRMPSTTINKGCYLIYSGFSDLHHNHHEWKNIKKILDGFATLKKINADNTFDINFNPQHKDRRQVCANHTSKYWLKMFKYWSNKLETQKSTIIDAAKQYINSKQKIKKYNQISNKWTHSKYKQYVSKHHELIQQTIKFIRNGIKKAESKINKEENTNYFTNYAKEHIDVYSDKVRPYIVVVDFLAHQPYSIKNNPVKAENYLDYTGKYNLKTNKITFSDNCSTQGIKNDLFGMGVQTNHADIRTYNAENKDQLITATIKFYDDVMGCFEAEGLEDDF